MSQKKYVPVIKCMTGREALLAIMEDPEFRIARCNVRELRNFIIAYAKLYAVVYHIHGERLKNSMYWEKTPDKLYGNVAIYWGHISTLVHIFILNSEEFKMFPYRGQPCGLPLLKKQPELVE